MGQRNIIKELENMLNCVITNVIQQNSQDESKATCKMFLGKNACNRKEKC